MARLTSSAYASWAALRELGIERLVAVLDELDHAGRVGQVPLALDDPERPRAAGEEVHPAVVHALEHPVDLARAADLPQAVVGEPHDPELALLAEALVHHRLVALLEDVERDQLARAARRCPSGNSGNSLDSRSGIESRQSTSA